MINLLICFLDSSYRTQKKMKPNKKNFFQPFESCNDFSAENLSDLQVFSDLLKGCLKSPSFSECLLGLYLFFLFVRFLIWIFLAFLWSLFSCGAQPHYKIPSDFQVEAVIAQWLILASSPKLALELPNRW